MERTTSVPPELVSAWRRRLRSVPLRTTPALWVAYHVSDRWCYGFGFDLGRFAIRGAGRRMRVERGCAGSEGLAELQALGAEIERTVSARLKEE